MVLSTSFESFLPVSIFKFCTLWLTFIHSSSDAKTQRQTGRQAQLSNISAAKAVADIIRTTLGPRSMLKVRTSNSHTIRSIPHFGFQTFKLVYLKFLRTDAS
jgi:hypothetical protein